MWAYPTGGVWGQEMGFDSQADVFSLSHRFAEMGGIPVNDDGAEIFSGSRPTIYRTLNRHYSP